jgi:hypothetical protein
MWAIVVPPAIVAWTKPRAGRRADMSGEVIFVIVIVAVSVAVPLVAMFWAFRKFGGAMGSIKNGLPAEAVIQSVGETGMTISSPGVGPEAAVYKLGLLVTPPGGGTPYATETTHAVPRIFMPMMLPGARIGVLVDPTDPQKVVPDWRRVGSAAAAAGGATQVASDMTGALALGAQGGTMSVDGVNVAFDASGRPVSGLDSMVGAIRGGTMNTEHGSAAALLATGTHGTAVITSAQPLGKKVRDYDPKADAARLDDPMWLFTLEVSLAGREGFPAMFGHRVPQAKVGAIAPGVKLAVAVDESNPTQEVAIDWDKSPLS